MRSSLSSLRRQRVVGKTAGSLEAAEGPRRFFLPTRVGRGGSHFFFWGGWASFLSFSGAPPPSAGGPDGAFPCIKCQKLITEGIETEIPLCFV